MTTKELLEPRFLVIADWPSNDQYKVGEIKSNIGPTFCDFLERYPHLFKKLEWWEIRKLEDMPQYVKQTGMVDSAENPLPDIFLKVKRHFNAGNGEWRDDSIRIFCADSYLSPLKNCSYTYSDWLPAPEEGYNAIKAES